MMTSRSVLLGGALLVAVAAVLTAFMFRNPAETVPDFAAFALVDGAGQTVRSSDYAGKFLLIYFGYSSCPDVCPTALAGVAAALGMLPPEKQDQVQPIFISLDPVRDHGDHLASYAAAFHPKMVGLTGTREQIDVAAASYGVRYEIVGDTSSDAYTVDHSSVVTVIDPDGRFVTKFTHQATPDAIVHKLLEVLP